MPETTLRWGPTPNSEIRNGEVNIAPQSNIIGDWTIYNPDGSEVTPRPGDRLVYDATGNIRIVAPERWFCSMLEEMK